MERGRNMVQAAIDSELKALCPEAALGLLECDVQVRQADAEFMRLMDGKIAELAETELSQANKREQIQLTRKGYKALGKDPNRYRCSAEAMCRRIAKERGLYVINNVVDINNYISIQSGYSMGTYDLSHISGEITWKRAPEGTAYQGIGKEVLNLSFLPVLFDAEGPFGNPTSDSTRAMVTEATKHILMVFYCFDGGAGMRSMLEEASRLLQKYADGQNVEISVIK